MPEGLYRRAKVRAYARAVRLDQESLAKTRACDACCRASAGSARRAKSSTTAFRKGILVTLAAIGAALVLGLVTRGREDKVPAAVQSIGAVDPEPPPQPTAPVDEAQRTTPENEQTPDAPVATVGPLPQPAPVPTTADIEPRVAQPLITELLITSEPAGARVTVDGIGWGLTPVTIRHLTPGTRHVRLTKDGYQSEERAARVAGDGLHALHVSLRAVP